MLLFALSLPIATAQGVNPDPTITSCESFLSAHDDLYSEAAQLQQGMLRRATQPSAFDQELYEKSLEINQRSAVLNATMEHLKKSGVMNVTCQNKVSQQEVQWMDKMLTASSRIMLFFTVYL